VSSLKKLLQQFHQQMVDEYSATLQTKLEQNIGVRFAPSSSAAAAPANVAGTRHGRHRIEAAIADLAKERGLRERDVELLRDAIAGEPRAKILKRRAISPNTFKTHVRLLVKKLEVPSMQDAALVVLRRALDSE
jgi:DNA-binding NarL/FixJ family response regulator